MNMVVLWKASMLVSGVGAKEWVEDLKHHMPISLVGNFYKLVTNKLKKKMVGKVVSKF